MFINVSKVCYQQILMFTLEALVNLCFRLYFDSDSVYFHQPYTVFSNFRWLVMHSKLPQISVASRAFESSHSVPEHTAAPVSAAAVEIWWFILNRGKGLQCQKYCPWKPKVFQDISLFLPIFHDWKTVLINSAFSRRSWNPVYTH